ncbi:hypothetical protein X975_09130, partial [Stegodyphus mimosarum]
MLWKSYYDVIGCMIAVNLTDGKIFVECQLGCTSFIVCCAYVYGRMMPALWRIFFTLIFVNSCFDSKWIFALCSAKMNFPFYIISLFDFKYSLLRLCIFCLALV